MSRFDILGNRHEPLFPGTTVNTAAELDEYGVNTDLGLWKSEGESLLDIWEAARDRLNQIRDDFEIVIDDFDDAIMDIAIQAAHYDPDLDYRNHDSSIYRDDAGHNELGDSYDLGPYDWPNDDDELDDDPWPTAGTTPLTSGFRLDDLDSWDDNPYDIPFWP